MVAYARRRIVVTFAGPAGTVVAQGLRTSCIAVTAGSIDMGSCEVAIYGLRNDEMNKLATFSTRFRPIQTTKMTVEAGDDVNGMSKIFEGTLDQAWADYQAMPDVPFHAIALSGLLEAVKTPDKNTAFKSFSGPTQASTIMQQLAANAGWSFENNGVSVTLDSPYLFGSILNMIKAVAQAGRFNFIAENGTLAIWPQGKARDGGAGGGMVISKETGMVTAPTFTDFGVLVKTEFTRPIDYGASFTIKSVDVPPANRTWYTVRKEYDLQALTPKGHWFLTLGGVEDPGFASMFLQSGV